MAFVQNSAIIGPKLKELREGAGLTQQGLADRAGIKKGGVRHLEQGTRSPRLDTLLKLAAALDVGVDEFTKPAKDETPRGIGRPSKPAPKKPAKRKKGKGV